ncbi:HET-domain-containing protein [Pholiota conissans]|uniref:HET-domain-containing protein n=1 Tax=Pholiota conissans TaxID=109636 RepID=A0A9P6CV47_9AGAR|nr:HET-domain-containing protein [Pholiota conissans]
MSADARAKAERLAKSARAHASAIKDRASGSLSKAIHSRLDPHLPRIGASLHDDPLTLVCAACREGPFTFKGFRQAVAEYHDNDDTGYSYTTTWSKISESIDKEGCSWCRVLRRTRDGLPWEKFPYGKENVEVRIQIETSSVSRNLSIYLDGVKAVTYTIYAEKGNPAVKEIGVEVTMFPKEPYVDYQKALNHIKKCAHHKHCPAPKETHLPTRVIDCSDPSKPRLVETNRQVIGHYCTLSYAWGGEQHQKTTMANIYTYIHEGINIPLPQTITDAIFATHKLGLRYLWVDALCIIQDSDEDKVKELSVMAHIYRDSYLTISVLSAFRADQGFLPDEYPPDILPYYVAKLPNSPGRMILEYNIPRQMPGKGKYETVEYHTPLDTRGWCFQESALSPRRLIFQPPNVSYKCRSFAEIDISRPSPLDRHPEKPTEYPADDHILFTTTKGKHGGAPHGERLEEIQRLWRDNLMDYSERKITVASDKFVAFASMVEVFQEVLNDEYIAGLWKQNLLYNLLWKIWPPMGSDETHLPRPQPYRAPTWSWASVDGKLDLHGGVDPPQSAASYEAEVVSWKVTPKNAELPFGEVVDAKLVVRAKIHPLMRDGSKCTFIEHKGKTDGPRYNSFSTSSSWSPPPGNCLDPIGFSRNRKEKEKEKGGDDEDGDEDEEDEDEEEEENDESFEDDDGDEDCEDVDDEDDGDGDDANEDGDNDSDKDEDEMLGVNFDCLEGTEADRPLDFHVLILRAGKNYRLQGDWMQGLLLVRVDGDEEQYRRVAMLDLVVNLQWPDWFDDAPLKMVTLV